MAGMLSQECNEMILRVNSDVFNEILEITMPEHLSNWCIIELAEYSFMNSGEYNICLIENFNVVQRANFGIGRPVNAVKRKKRSQEDGVLSGNHICSSQTPSIKGR